MAKKKSKVDTILDTRQTQYGLFINGATVMIKLKSVLQQHCDLVGTRFEPDQEEAMHMIVHKIGRIVNGNPDNVDSWRDIAGYATLVADRLEGNAR
jgi:hypothetical protein